MSRRRPRRHRRECVEVVARRCKGASLVLHGTCSHLADMLRDRGDTPTPMPLIEEGSDPLDPAALDLPSVPYRTVILDGVLPLYDSKKAAHLLERLVGAYADAARILAVVPNPDAGKKKAGPHPYGRRQLRRLLRGVGRPRLVKDQPYRWLVMQVDRKLEGPPRLSRAVRARYRVTSRLCRGKVLELGCGKGHLTQAISNRGHDVVGVDLSKKQIADARKFHPGLTLLQSDARSLEFPDAAFDTVVLAEILEHVTDEVGEEILHEAERLLASPGRLIVSVPNEDCIPHPAHLREFDRQSLRRLLSRFGRPVLVKDQPYRWLTMYVDRER